MPILEVELVGQPGPVTRQRLAQRIADAVSPVFGSRSGQTWVRLRVLPREDYAESGSDTSGVRPIFVSVTKRVLGAHEALRAEAARIAEVVASACVRPVDNVHVIYQPAGAGRIAFGGELVEA